MGEREKVKLVSAQKGDNSEAFLTSEISYMVAVTIIERFDFRQNISLLDSH